MDRDWTTRPVTRSSIRSSRREPRAAGLGSGSKRLGRRLALRVPREAVVGDRLPGGGVRDELVPLRTNAGIAVERPQPDAHRAASRVPAPERAPADGAEALREALVRDPLRDELLAGEHAERPRDDARLSGCSRARASLAACAVTVRG